MKAVRENNKTAVNYLYGRNLTPPSDNDRRNALKIAEENRKAFDTEGNVNMEKCAKQIIEKLTTARPEVESGSKIETDAVPKVDSPRGEYMRLIKKIRGKSNREAFDDLEEDLKQMADILQRIKYGGRNKNPYSAGSGAGFSAGSGAGSSARSSARSP